MERVNVPVFHRVHIVSTDPQNTESSHQRHSLQSESTTSSCDHPYQTVDLCGEVMFMQYLHKLAEVGEQVSKQQQAIL